MHIIIKGISEKKFQEVGAALCRSSLPKFNDIISCFYGRIIPFIEQLEEQVRAIREFMNI
jgi:hypothetical protein